MAHTTIRGVTPGRWFSAGGQSEQRAVSPLCFPAVSHAVSKWLPVTCCSVSYPNTWQSFNPVSVPFYGNDRYHTESERLRRGREGAGRVASRKQAGLLPDFIVSDTVRQCCVDRVEVER